MKFLLDTHVILWLAYSDKKISKQIKELLLSNDSEIYLSAVSFWEISIKYQTGKLDLKHHNPETLMSGFEQNFECHILDLNIKEAISYYRLDKMHHKDPFDRMLIWQALQHELTFITDDENIKMYSDIGLKVVW